MVRRLLSILAPVLAAAATHIVPAQPCLDVDTRIDSAPDQGAQVNICPCFAPGEVAMTILDVPLPTVHEPASRSTFEMP